MVTVPKSLQDRLILELRHAHAMMSESSDPHSVLYFFSAAYAEVGRILNAHWDARLSLLHLVLQTTYGAMNSRLQAVAEGRDRPVEIPNTAFDSLTSTMADLMEAITNKQDNEFLEVLCEFAELCYLSTGNGYYLYTKGALKIN